MRIHNPLSRGKAALPPDTQIQAPIQFFQLFWPNDLYEILAENTNRYAELHPLGLTRPNLRSWVKTTAAEIKAFIGVYIYASVYPVVELHELWNQSSDRPLHRAITEAIGRTRFEQINHFFHISNPTEEALKKTSPFVKTSPLSDRLRSAWSKYWSPGRNLAVDETIQAFTGRSSDIVNIPSKPTPEGYKIWALADHGYVIDFLYHSRGQLTSQGPIGLKKKWTKNDGFSKTEAVVMELAERLISRYATQLPPN